MSNVNLLYGGHALSYTSAELSYFTGMHPRQRKEIFQKMATQLKMLTGRGKTSWPFTKRDRGFELATTETNPASSRVEALNPGLLDYNTSALNHLATLPLITCN